MKRVRMIGWDFQNDRPVMIQTTKETDKRVYATVSDRRRAITMLKRHKYTCFACRETSGVRGYHFCLYFAK